MAQLHVVLYEPEIANNVGAIIRICYAFNAQLHLIAPFGFVFDSRFVKRASVQYVNKKQYLFYDNWDHFFVEHASDQLLYATRYGKQNLLRFALNIPQPVYLVFGKESSGIPRDLLAQHQTTCFRIPMQPQARCLNVATTVAISCYEYARQNDFAGLSTTEFLKGAHFLDQFRF